MKPEEFLKYHVEKITTLNEIISKFRLYFPNLKFSYDLIPAHNGTETLKIKDVEGLGKHFYYSQRGKLSFHEHLLDYICKELRKQKIPYVRNKKISADLHVKGFYIELEIRSNPPKQPEKRNDLLRRIRRNPDKTILIFCNRKDKEAYLHSPAREIIISNNRFFTIPEFLDKIGKL